MPYKLYVALKTQEENAKSESDWLLNRLNLTGITHFGKQYKTHTQAGFQIDAYIVSYISNIGFDSNPSTIELIPI